jgi:inorganic pyrophosphatase
VSDLPQVLVQRLHHYFSTYKLIPGTDNHVSIDLIYDADHAARVIEASMADYDETFGQ